MQQGRGGGQGNQFDQRVREIEDQINQYLDTEEVKNILTPGEYSEWPLKMKAGQVMIAGARSDAFDPALEVVKVVDKDVKVLATNDDRFLGDQRPLLLWRCTADGEYKLRARCFHDKSGGQFFLKVKVYECVDAASEQMTERSFDKAALFLVRMPMKAGQIKQPLCDFSNLSKYTPVQFTGPTISPTGLPNAKLAEPILSIVSSAVIAPVDGDYYVMASYYVGDKRTVRIGAREIVPSEIVRSSDSGSAKARTNTATVWTLKVKKGEVLTAAEAGLYPGTEMVVTERPDFSKFDLAKEEANPFYPPPADRKEEEPAVVTLAGRARDNRVSVFVAQRDAVLWLASSGSGPANQEYTLRVGPGTQALAEAKALDGKLQIGMNDYWSFDAKAGDVMTFSSEASGFAQSLRVLGPALEDAWTAEAQPDQGTVSWNLVVQKPGRYMVGVSAIGDGGGGTYTLRRDVLHAKEFKKGTAAVGSFAGGPVEVWKFTAAANDPVLLHWKSTGGGYSVSVRNENGAELQLPRTWVGANEQYGVLSLSEAQTYVIVLTLAPGQKAQYTIELLDLPGRGGAR